jgi:hypothetical protein
LVEPCNYHQREKKAEEEETPKGITEEGDSKLVVPTPAFREIKGVQKEKSFKLPKDYVSTQGLKLVILQYIRRSFH